MKKKTVEKTESLYPESEKISRKKLTISDVVDGAGLFKSGIIDKSYFNDIILEYVSNDENALPNILKILEFERKNKKELLQDTNMELSRALVAFEMYEKNTPTNLKQKRWIVGEIKKHYIKWKNFIGCCFKVVGLD
jgi:hypothetical protein